MEPLAQQRFQDALQAIPPFDKLAYLSACEQCPPSIFSDEVRVEPFVAHASGDPESAARRYVKYWEVRRSIFGPDRAFLPLLSDLGSAEAPVESALSAEDIEILETGSLQPMPPDKLGRSVLHFDRTRLSSDMTRGGDSRLRCLFYVLQRMLVENTSARARELVVTGIAYPQQDNTFDLGFAKGVASMVAGLPFRLTVVHLFLTSSALCGYGEALDAFVSPAIPMIKNYCSCECFAHYGERVREGTDNERSASMMWKDLNRHGFIKKNLPACVGGKLTYEGHFLVWLKRHRRQEQAIFWTDAQRLHRKRDVNVIHSKEKRERRRQEEDTLRREIDLLTAQIRAARRTNLFLEELLAEAKQLASTTSPSTEQVLGPKSYKEPMQDVARASLALEDTARLASGMWRMLPLPVKETLDPSQIALQVVGTEPAKIGESPLFLPGTDFYGNWIGSTSSVGASMGYTEGSASLQAASSAKGDNRDPSSPKGFGNAFSSQDWQFHALPDPGALPTYGQTSASYKWDTESPGEVVLHDTGESEQADMPTDRKPAPKQSKR